MGISFNVLLFVEKVMVLEGECSIHMRSGQGFLLCMFVSRPASLHQQASLPEEAGLLHQEAGLLHQ